MVKKRHSNPERRTSIKKKTQIVFTVNERKKRIIEKLYQRQSNIFVIEARELNALEMNVKKNLNNFHSRLTNTIKNRNKDLFVHQVTSKSNWRTSLNKIKRSAKRYINAFETDAKKIKNIEERLEKLQGSVAHNVGFENNPVYKDIIWMIDRIKELETKK